MANNQINKLLEFVNMQMAAEAFLMEGADQGVIQPDNVIRARLERGNTHASKFTSAVIGDRPRIIRLLFGAQVGGRIRQAAAPHRFNGTQGPADWHRQRFGHAHRGHRRSTRHHTDDTGACQRTAGGGSVGIE
jgi:hypothetical protein